VHNITVTPEIAAQVRALIQDEAAAQSG